MFRRSPIAVSSVVIALAVTLAIAALEALGGASLFALEWSMYDHWLRSRQVAGRHAAVVAIVRDAASEERFGAGAWDYPLLARVVSNLGSAGASVIGMDLVLGPADASGRGGAAGEALLSEATAVAPVVYPMALEPLRESPPRLAQRARGTGHVLAPADPDGVVRRIPLFVRHEGRTVPAFGLALAAAFLGSGPDRIAFEGGSVILQPASGRGAPVRARIDPQGRTLIGFAGSGLPRDIDVVPLSEVWAAIAGRRPETLRRLVEDRLVLVLAEPAPARLATPVGPMSDVAVQVHLLDTLLAETEIREAPAVWSWLGVLLIGALVAWLWLRLPWWAGLLGVVALAAADAATVALALTRTGLVLPVWPPLAAVVLASAGAGVTKQFASSYRLQQLEGENARAREALVRQESAVEALEEDLEAARVAVARSSGAERELAQAAEALRAQLAEARTQEEETRRRLADLRRELRGLRPAEAQPGLADGGQENLRRESESLGIVTRDPGMLALFLDLKKAARASLPILLLGEPGTGKELFARAAHRLSPRAGHPFVAVNMAAIPPDLFESELFGHVKGSFTGAVGDRKGYFEQADGGTIFLDEIGELKPEHQSKLLRVLQDQTFYRVGASQSTAVDVRVVAATNRDLDDAVAQGRFREDLYFRLKGLILRLPPLRERPGDVPELAARLFAGIVIDIDQGGMTLSQEAVAALQAHDWPGNVRELDNVLRRAVALAEGPVISAKDLRLSAGDRSAARGVAGASAESASDAAVLACLRRHRFDMQATGRALGWDRSTVTQRLKGVGFRALVECGGDRERAALELAGDPALVRTVEVKLRDYHEHLLRAIEGYDSAATAVAACRRRFKNLPERHFRYLESLVRQHFGVRGPSPGA